MPKQVSILLWAVVPAGAGIIYPYVKAEPQYLEWLTTGLLFYVLFFSIVVHELCHGLAANLCGDPTAKDSGRLTFNPISHVSLIGSIIVPLTLALTKAPMVFGWAKPVPFNPINLRQHPRDQVMLAVAGPLSNFALSYICFTLFLIAGVIFNHLFSETPIFLPIDVFAPLTFEQVPFEAFWFVLFEILSFGIIINLVLGVFNLLPFPPLDGSWLLKALLPKKAMAVFGKIQPYGFFLIFVALWFNLLTIFFYPVVLVMGVLYFVAQFVLTL